MTTSRPRVGISRCLLGDEVRYDGGHKLQRSLIEALSRHVELVAVCPEVEVGLGVPREPIQIVVGSVVSGGRGRRRLVGVSSGRDWTEQMHEWAQRRIRELAALRLSGFVLKARSPSCGIRDVPVAGGEGGAGMFAEALLAAMPNLPVEDEEQLAGAAARAAFLRRVAAYYDWQRGHQ